MLVEFTVIIFELATADSFFLSEILESGLSPRENQAYLSGVRNIEMHFLRFGFPLGFLKNVFPACLVTTQSLVKLLLPLYFL